MKLLDVRYPDGKRETDKQINVTEHQTRAVVFLVSEQLGHFLYDLAGPTDSVQSYNLYLEKKSIKLLNDLNDNFDEAYFQQNQQYEHAKRAQMKQLSIVDEAHHVDETNQNVKQLSHRRYDLSLVSEKRFAVDRCF